MVESKPEEAGEKKEENLTKDQKKMIEEFRTIPLTGLEQALDSAKSFGQYCIIADKTDNANVYFNYKATQKDFYADVMSVKMGAETKEEICEKLRKAMVFCMQRGENYVLYCKKEKPNWREMFDDEESWPVEKIFDHDTWFEKENYISIVREEENVDYEGNKGAYEMREDKFQFILLHDYTDAASLKEFLTLIPFQDDFAKLMIADTEEAKAAFAKTNASLTDNQNLQARPNIEQFKDYSCGKGAPMQVKERYGAN